MGNGIRSNLLVRGVKNITVELLEKLNDIKVYGEKLGYIVKTYTIQDEESAYAMLQYLAHLETFQKAMGESDAIIQSTGGILKLHHYDPYSGIRGDSRLDGTIRLSADEITNIPTTLVHEHTHCLVNTLIEKQLKHPRGTFEHTTHFLDATMYRDINETAFEEWKYDLLDKLHRTKAPQSQIDKVESIKTTYEAARFSGMRDYATEDYDFAPKGSGIEIPSVASEVFYNCNYDWKTFKKTGGYAYYVLKELKSRLNKYG
jgi:hypothetical protein